jgi:hypothetical protein
LILSGTGDYLGGTTVAQGTSIVTNSYSLRSGSNLSVGSNLVAFQAATVPGNAYAAEPVSVPEPSTLAILATVTVCVLALTRLKTQGENRHGSCVNV